MQWSLGKRAERMVKTMNDTYLTEHGYKEYTPTPFDNEHIVARFQKRFDDNFGKKYFINVLKWSNDFIPTYHRDKYWEPFSYEYEVQVDMNEDENPIILHFFTSWTLEKVENFMEEFFEKMKPNYCEAWDTEDRHVRPKE
jgi:hypothetical protein